MIPASLSTPFITGTLYGIGKYSFVLRSFLPKAKKIEVTLPEVDEHAGHNHAPGDHGKPAPAPTTNAVSIDHANAFGFLLSQKQGGRLVPLGSLALDILQYIYCFLEEFFS